MKFGLIFMMISGVAIMAATPYLMKNFGAIGGSEGISQIYSEAKNAESTSSTRQTFFKWQDASGQWHFGDEVPEGVTGVPVNVDTAANILAPVSTPKPAQSQSNGLSSMNTSSPGLPVITPSKAEEALRKAEELKTMMEQRTQYLDSQL